MINRKIKNHIFIPLLFVFLFLQTTFIPQFFGDNYAPNIVLLLLLAFSALDNKSINIFYIAFLSGFILDLFSGSIFGIVMVAMLVAIFTSAYLNYYFLKELFSYKLFLISSFAVLIYNIIYIFLININDLGQIYFNIRPFLLIVVFQLICVMILIYPLTRILCGKNEK